MSEILDLRPAAPDTGPGHDGPLSFLQEQLWLVETLEEDEGLYNEIWVLGLEGELDTAAVAASLDDVVLRHDALRTCFPVVGDGPRALVRPTSDVALGEVVDLSHLPDDEHGALVANLAQELADRPYDLESGPLLRCALLRIGPRRHTLLLAVHHIVSDGHSRTILIDDLGRAYRGRLTAAPEPLVPPPADYADFAREQRAGEDGPEWRQALEHWREHLSGAPALLDLTPGRLRPARKGTAGARIEVDLDLPPDAGTGIERLARQAGATRTSVLMAAFAAVLHRYTGCDDLVLGTAGLGRPRPEFQRTIGYFATTLPLRLRPSGGLPFEDFLIQATDTLYDALDHQILPFGKMVEELRPERDPSHGPLVQVMFSQVEPLVSELVPGVLSVRSEEKAPRSRSRFDLVIEPEVTPRGIRAWVEYDTELFDEAWVRSLCAHYARFLTEALRAPGTPLGDVPMLAPGEDPTREAEPGVPVEVVLTGAGAVAPPGVVGLVHRYVRSPGGDGTSPRGIFEPGWELGRWSPKGGTVRVGRADRIPEVDGIRIPLDRIGAVAAVHPDVRSCDVDVDYDEEGTATVVARLRPTSPGCDLKAVLEEYLAERLPRYALPTLVVLEGGAPGTAPAEGSGHEGGEASGHLLGTVLDLFREVLDDPHLGPDDEFFSSGGYSMLAAHLVRTLRVRHGIDAPLKLLFQSPTPRGLAEALTRTEPPGPARRAGGRRAPARAEEGEPSALTAAQADMWVVSRLSPNVPVYNVPMDVRITGPLSVEALTRAFATVVERHEVLRSSFALSSGELVRRPLESARPRLRTLDLACVGEASGAAAESLAAEEARHVFSLGEEAPLRAVVVTHDEHRHQLILTFHHIAMDGIGFSAFCHELGIVYRAALAGTAPDLPAPELTWAEYAEWESEWIAGGQEDLVAYWAERLRDIGRPRVPTELPRDGRKAFGGAAVRQRLDGALASELTELAARQGVSPFAVTTAALSVLWSSLTGETDLPIGTPAENRHLPGSANLVGCCIGSLILRTDLSGDPSFEEVARRTDRTTREAYRHQGVPMSTLLRLAGADRSAGRVSLFQVSSEWQERDASGLELEGCAVEVGFTPSGTIHNELSLLATRSEAGVDLELGYSTALWTEDGARAWLGAVVQVLALAVEEPGTSLSGFAARIDTDALRGT